MNTRNTIIYLYFYSNNYMFLYFTKSSVLAIRGTSLEVPLLIASPDDSLVNASATALRDVTSALLFYFLFISLLL